MKECTAPWPVYEKCNQRDPLIREGIIHCLKVDRCPFGDYDANLAKISNEKPLLTWPDGEEFDFTP